MGKWLIENAGTILTCGVSLFSVALSYVLGRLEHRWNSKSSVQKERYEKFYIQYIQKLYVLNYPKGLPFHKMSFKTRASFQDLIMNNIQYIDKKSAEMIPSIYQSFMDYLEYEDGNKTFADAPAFYDRTMNEFTLRVLRESQALSKSLFLPDSSSILLNGDYSKSEREPNK